MEHIKSILARRKSALFAMQMEKGSREWSTFNSVVGDQLEMFPVASPRARNTPRCPNTVHIRREPRHLTPKFSR